MDRLLPVLAAVFLPLLGTALGAGAVFFIRGEIRQGVQRLLLGFAAGIMIAASVWSLLIPAVEMAAESGKTAWLPALLGFLLGAGFLLFLDSVIPHLHLGAQKPEGRPSKLGKSFMLMLAVTLHNIPEGMAVGVVVAGMLGEGELITLASALTLSAGIAIQNFPEGAIISMPLLSSGMNKGKAFKWGFFSGAVEPIAAIITILLARLMTPVLPAVLAFAAGAMIYVVVEELIPEARRGEHSNLGTVGAIVGFALMMVLDVALG